MKRILLVVLFFLGTLNCLAAGEQVYVPGLLAGTLTGNMDKVSPNPGNLGIDPLGPSSSEAAERPPLPPWANYTTVVYTGQFFDEDGYCGFYENIDDRAMLVVDGIVLLDDLQWNVPTAWVGQLSGGWHDFELRMWNSGGNAGRAGPLGFGYDPTGEANGSTSYEDYAHPQNSDPFTADVFRTIVQSPVAEAGEDIIADANEKVVLDASLSTDPDGNIVQYTWTALPEEEVLYSGPNSIFETKALGRVEEVIKLTVTDNTTLKADDTVSIFNRRLEEIELTPGPQGPQGQQGPQGEQGPQGPQGPPGITPEEIAQMQAQIASLQQENAALLQQIQELQKIVAENSKLLERLPQLQKGLKE